jgi:glycerate-2-kinase
VALNAARRKAVELGYQVIDFGSAIAGETVTVAADFASIIRSHQRTAGIRVGGPVCLLSGGETTVTLPGDHGLGGRNQEFALAVLCQLGQEGLRGVAVLSGGTDGEDGPTDAAGAVSDEAVSAEAEQLGLDPTDFLARHDAYPFFDRTGGLLRTGLTNTNVMDVRVILIQ